MFRRSSGDSFEGRRAGAAQNAMGHDYRSSSVYIPNRHREQMVQRGQIRRRRSEERERENAVVFFMAFVDADCPRIAVENPVGIMSTRFRKPDQIIQPYQFGDPFEKKTCLWLKGLPKLIPQNEVPPPEKVFFKSGRSMPKWYADSWNLPKEERAKLRSKTFPGIARAMADQWGGGET